MHVLTTLFSYEDYTYTTTTSSSGSFPVGLFVGFMAVYFLIILVLLIVPLWKIYSKAGKPGWASIIPFYNTWVLFEIVGYPGWWAVLLIIPLVNIFPAVMALVAYFKLAKLFGKGDGFAVCTVLFPYICLPILGYGNAQFAGDGIGGGTPSSGSYAPVSDQPYPPQPPQPPQQPTPPQNPPVVQG